jgi:N-acetylmuramoyl-L-alanine amidase
MPSVRTQTQLAVSLAAVILGILSGCAPSVYYVTPRGMSTPAAEEQVIATFRPYLEGRKIFLDPGHGGDDRVNRGPEGEAIEADINLSVGLALREFLTRAGAIVVMSRSTDMTVPLRERPVLAVDAGADMFISLHHNASGDPLTNYSSVYYHAYEGHPEYHPANRDIARYVQRDMSYAMRNPSAPLSPYFDGTLSDFGVYPNSGFAVLRHDWLPAILVEASFFTHPYEEQRLALPAFNRIEAWGIFVGLGRYFQAGMPQLDLRSDSVLTDPETPLIIGVSSQRVVDSSSAHATLDGEVVHTRYDARARLISVQSGRPLPGGFHTLSAWIRNEQGNASWHFKKRIAVDLPAADISLALSPPDLPAGYPATSRAFCTITDRNGDPVIDGTIIRLLSPSVNLDTALIATNGAAHLDIHFPAYQDSASVTAEADSVTVTNAVHFVHTEKTYMSGRIVSAGDTAAIADARFVLAPRDLPDTSFVVARSWTDGRFVFFRDIPPRSELRVEHSGFFPCPVTLPAMTHADSLKITLAPVAAGLLLGRTYLLDARYGGNESGEVAENGERAADVNLAITTRLEQLLRAAGADVSEIRTSDMTITEKDRAQLSAAYPPGFYLRIDAAGPADQASCSIHSSIPNRTMAASLLHGLAVVAGLDTGVILTPPDQFYRDVALRTISVTVPSIRTTFYEENRERSCDKLAWGVFAGILKYEGFARPAISRYRALDPTGRPLNGVRAILSETMSTFTDPAGYFTFYGLEPEGAVIRIAGDPTAQVIMVQAQTSGGF